MEKDELIVCFKDTLEKSNNGDLKQRTSKAIKSNHVYEEGFVSKAKQRNEKASIDVYSGTTFEVAKRYRTLGKIAVLNFANPETPGGGVQFGAMAQEECLCRSSNLFACISDQGVFNEYYGYHRRIRNHFYTDRLIYTKDVTVFKDDSFIPQLMSKDDWFEVDVITCAAPYLAKRKHTNGTALFALFKSRVKNIFEAARDNKVDYLILGAFGCGAFKNPPLIVAEAFFQTIKEQNYQKDFKQIVFAIKPNGENCANLNMFKHRFDGFTYAYNENSLEWRTRRNPVLPTEDRFFDNSEFGSWQMCNKYFGKQFSILGDSISTLDGFNPKGYKVFYTDDQCVQSGVVEPEDTWWDKVIAFFGGELLVNNSWSGSRVTKIPERKQLFPSGCSAERTEALHINDVRPDVILVYLGTNDWAFGAKTGNETRVLDEDNNVFFNEAYTSMLKSLKANYPESEIWCCTLCETYISKSPDFKFQHKYAGTHIEEYNDIIRYVARRHNCKLIDLYDYKMTYDSIDGSHPTNIGMNTIATMIIRAMAGREADAFLDCEDNQHEYKVAEEYTGGTRYVCSRCGKTIHKSNLPATECPENQHEYVMYNQTGSYDYYKCRKCGKIKQDYAGGEMIQEQDNNIINETEYVMLDPNITTQLYSDTLRLTIESSGKTVQFQKNIVEVGRSKMSDLLLEGQTMVARRQATFLYERNIWFLRDNYSTNGTWINGAKMQPGKKYQLAINDEINFAMAEKIIFDKQEYNVHPSENPDAKALVFLEAGMSTFAKSDYKDEVAWKLIIAALSDAPLYFPVEIDMEAMLGSTEPTKLKVGDVLQLSKDVKMRILTLTPESGVELVPMFTSNDEVNKGTSASVIRLYPQDYLPKLVQMDKPVIINPFSENKFLLSTQMITEVLLPLVQNKMTPQTDVMEQPTDKYVGKTIDSKYEVLKLLGGGGFYNTYLVRNIHDNRVWAMKVCDKNNRHYSPAMREHILTEPYMMQKLNHPAIPKVVDIIEDEDSIFIVREYIEGENLELIVKNHGAQPVNKVVEWGKQMCNALGYLHSQTPPIIFRDMKPSNVILKSDGTLKLIDFGIALTYDFQYLLEDIPLGTLGYAAPEQYMGQSRPQTDIYGLGMTMHHLVTGMDPTKSIPKDVPICQINPNFPKGLEYIITKCTQPNPDERYQSCDELMDDLNNYLGLPKSKGLFGKWFGKK